MLSASVATYDENPKMYRLVAVKFFGTHVPVRNWWYAGGAFHQGPGYADARFQSDCTRFGYSIAWARGMCSIRRSNLFRTNGSTCGGPTSSSFARPTARTGPRGWDHC